MLDKLSKQLSKKDWEVYFMIKEDRINNINCSPTEKLVYQGLVCEEWKKSFLAFSTADKRIIFHELASDIHEALYNLYHLPTLPMKNKVVA